MEPIATLREIGETLVARPTRGTSASSSCISSDPAQKRSWLRERMEPVRNEDRVAARGDGAGRSTSLVEAEAFERFLHTRFVGHKRFSIEGGETLIPVIDALLGWRR